jgi:hypothetical protein
MAEQPQLNAREWRTYPRTRLALSLAGLVSFVLALVAFVTAAFLHSSTWGRAGGAALCFTAATTVIREGHSLSLALKGGRWTDLKGTTIDRHVQPARFWMWTLINSALFAVYMTVAGVLGYAALFWPPQF